MTSEFGGGVGSKRHVMTMMIVALFSQSPKYRLKPIVGFMITTAAALLALKCICYDYKQTLRLEMLKSG